MKKTAQLFFIFIFFFTAQFSFAQSEKQFDFYARGNYRANVPRPSELLRFDVGNFHTTYAQMESVVNAIAKASPDRVRVFDIGETNEHRMQHVVAISSPENILALDRIKSDNARLADPRKTSQSEANAIAEKNPAIVWLAYTIHGNESASFETMMQVVYQLAASDEPATLDILKNCVTLIITGENPDGHERFVSWYNSVGVGDANPFALEHREPWSVYGRLSHYRFDLNRDALVTSQKESQNLQRAFLEWNPQVSADHHGQPSQYFFPPDALPINPNLPEPQFSRWNEIYGRANAAAFDRNKWDYYVRDVFDAFYPGYWDMYPSLNGAIGMTYETDGGGTKGLRYMRDDGTIATLRSATAKHFVASMTTLETTAKHKAERIRDFYSFRADAMKNFASSKMKRVVIVPNKDRVKSAELVEALTRARIEVKKADQAFSSATAHSYMEQPNSAADRKTFPAGSYVIDLNQPQRILAKSILEPDTPQDKAFVDDNLARFRRNQMKGRRQSKEDFGFYDITAWSLPLAYGLDAYWTEDGGSTSGPLVTAASLTADKAGNFPGRAEISYIIPYETDSTSAMVIRLLQNDVRVNVASKPLNAGGRNWPAGTFVIRVSRNDDDMHQKVERFAKEMGVNVVPVNSGFADEGDTSVGGESVVSLHAPKIVVAADDGVDQTSFGSIWWTLDRFGIEFTAMSIRSIRNGGLKDHTVLILPDGSAGQMMSQFGASGVAALKDWVADGGTVITVRGASVFATLKDVGLTTSKLVGSGDDEKKDAAPSAEAKPSAPTAAAAKPDKATTEPKANPSTEDMANDSADRIPGLLPPIVSPSADANKVPVPLPGSIMRATVDRTSYINYGVEQDELPVLLAGGYFFKYSKEGTNALVFVKAPLTISGFVWPGNTERLLAGTSYLIDEPNGGGHAILFAEEPFFRGVFRGTTRQFFNAIAFNGAF
ncbi:MAG: hypothetical protein K1X52_00655 [Pyrinomonadaceae bacterium]|nr:hypothetical protein [Pyrinomonadaceae bacterium]